MRKLTMAELGRLQNNEALAAKKKPLVVLLDNVRSMHNVGSVFRSCDAFAVQEVVLCGFTPQPPHREIQKTALGATESVRWSHMPDAAGALAHWKHKGALLAAVEQTDSSTSLSLFSLPPDQTLVLVFGNEVDGVQDEVLALCDTALEIPQWGAKHSLNISVAVGIVLYHLTTR